jgi:hypothetical protein
VFSIDNGMNEKGARWRILVSVCSMIDILGLVRLFFYLIFPIVVNIPWLSGIDIVWRIFSESHSGARLRRSEFK